MANHVKLLSGKQLVENGGKKSDSFLPDKGPKSVLPNNSWLEKKQIESALEDRKFVLHHPRIEKRGTLTHAEWIDDKQKALVKEKRGGQWLHMGQTYDLCTYLLPEETLHLMEMNALELTYGRVPVSIQQAYSLLLGKSVTLEEYRVYSLLSRQGYKLIRHNEVRVYSEESDINENLGNVENKLNEHNSSNSPKSDDIHIDKTNDKSLSFFKPNSTNADDIEVEPNINNNSDEPNCVNVMTIDDNSVSISNSNLTNTDHVDSEPNSDSNIIEHDCPTMIDNNSCHSSDTQNPENIISEETNYGNGTNDLEVESCEIVSNIEEQEPLIHLEKEVQSNCIDLDDSSSDDCVMIAESVVENECDDMNTNNVDAAHPDNHMSLDESDTIEVECLPSFSFKLKILDSIPNCYHRNFLHLKAPKEKFIPSTIKLTKENYVIFFNRLSNKNNIENEESDYTDSQTPDLTLRSITNFRHNDRNESNCNHRNSNRNNDYNQTNRYASYNNTPQFHQYAGSNNFTNNAYFFNHIFQNMTRQRPCFTNNFAQMGGLFSRLNNFSQRPFFFPQLNRQCFASNFYSQPSIFFCHARQQFFFQNGSQQTSSNHNNYSTGRVNISFPPINSQNVHSQQRSHASGQKRPHKRQNKESSIPANRSRNNISSTISTLPNKKTEFIGYLCKIESLITKFSAIPCKEQSEELKDALNLAVCKFNSKFNENYTLEFTSTKCVLKKLCTDKKENDKILQLSSDSDSSPVKKSRASHDLSPSSDSGIKRKVNRKLRAKRSKSDCHLTFQVNIPNSSSDSDIDFHSDSSYPRTSKIKNMAEIRSKLTSSSLLLPIDNSKKVVQNIPDTCSKKIKDHDSTNDKDIFGLWYPKVDSWNKPIHSLTKPKHSHLSTVNIKISNAILNNIREMSYEKTYSIESWGQAKKLFDRKNNSNTVCISDDESTPNEPSESVLGGNISIKIDKIHPLVRPQDCTSVSSVLKRLQIIKSAYEDNLKHDNTKENSTLKISYDMYLPSSKNLRKSNLPPPAFSIIILSDKSPLPSPEALSLVMESLPQSVPFLLAIVSFDTVSFVQMEHINIPDLVKSDTPLTNLPT